MELKKRFVKAAAVTVTLGAVTIGGLGFGVASADEGPRPQGRNQAPGATARAPMAGRADLASLAAQKLGISVEALRQQMGQGRSAQQIAVQRGVAYGDLKTTLVNALGAQLQASVANGSVTQADANTRVSLIPQQVETFLTSSARGAGAPSTNRPAFSGQPGNRPMQGGDNQPGIRALQGGPNAPGGFGQGQGGPRR